MYKISSLAEQLEVCLVVLYSNLYFYVLWLLPFLRALPLISHVPTTQCVVRVKSLSGDEDWGTQLCDAISNEWRKFMNCISAMLVLLFVAFQQCHCVTMTDFFLNILHQVNLTNYCCIFINIGKIIHVNKHERVRAHTHTHQTYII